MTFSNIGDYLFDMVEWLDVLIATVVVFAFAWVWYGPLMGKAWRAETGREMSNPDPMTMGKGFVKFLIFVLGIYALVPAVHVIFGNATSFETLIVTSFFVTFVTFGVGLGSRVIWEGSSWKLWGIDYLFWFLAAAIGSYVLDLLA